MEATTTNPPTAKAPGADSSPPPDLKHLADQLASKHSANFSASARQVNKGGRRTVAEEANEWLQKNGLRAVPADSQPQTPADPGPGYVVHPEFVRQMAELAMKGVEAYRQRATYLKAVAIGADKALAKELAEGNGAPPGAIEVISYSLAEIAQKYDWLSRWTPEVAILFAAGAWMTKDVATMRRLEAIRRENEAVKEQPKKTASSNLDQFANPSGFPP